MIPVRLRFRKALCLVSVCSAVACISTVAGPLSVPKLTGRVVDQAKLLSSGDAARLDQALTAFAQATRGQMAVLIVRTLGDDSLEGFSIRVADEWQLGDKERDDGLILLIAVEERRSRLEVGQGFEGQIPDARAGDLLREMAPYFREGRYADGMLHVVDGATRQITGKPLSGITVPRPRRRTRQTTARTGTRNLPGTRHC